MPRQFIAYFDQSSQASLWTDPNAFATCLVTLFLDTYGTEGITWHPNTIQMEVEEDFHVDMPPPNYDRLMAGLSLFTSNSFYNSLPDFIRTCVILNGHHIPGDQLELADAADCAWGITEAMLLNPPLEEEPFSEEIRGYVGHMLDQEGILTPPDVLRIALRDTDLMDKVRYGFSDDPVMFGAIQDMESSKTNAINHLIQGRLRSLFKQLADLPLKSADAKKTKALVDKMLKSLPGDEDLPLPG